MKKRVLSILCCASLIMLNACMGDSGTTSKPDDESLSESVVETIESQEESIAPPAIPEDYTEIFLDEKAGENTFGVSVEFDPHFLSQNVKKGLVSEDDWQIIVDRVEKMEIDRFRVMLMPSWIEPFNDNSDDSSINWDNLTLESEEMKSVYKVLDLAQANGIDVNLTLWGVENNANVIDSEINATIKSQGGHFLAEDNEGSSHWMIGTHKPEEFAENFSIYIQHLINNKGYDCIKEITPYNEPDMGYLIDGQISFEGYADLCQKLHDRFVADGIRDKVLFTLSDNIDIHRNWLTSTMENLDDITDIYSSHTYIFGYETENSEIEGWEEENINVTRYTGKPHVVGEFGSNLTIGSSRQSDIDEYERGVLIVREMLNFYNAGAAGSSYWVLFDQYYSYTDPYDSMMQLGLWKSSKQSYYTDTSYYEKITEDYEVRPQYYAFSLMSKYLPKGAEVYPIYLDDDFAVGTAFKGKDGKWVYVFANGNNEGSKKLALYANGTFDMYQYLETALPTGDNLIEKSGTSSNGLLAFDLQAQSVVVFVHK